MTITKDQHAEIEEIVLDILEIEPDEMTPTSLFKEDHHADSLLAIEILAALERTFHITIPQAELARMVNMEGVHAVVAEAASTR
jgi:acyl carrier protein